MVCTCERLMVQFAHVPRSGGKSYGEKQGRRVGLLLTVFSA